ncbi:MAG: ABC transporter ATP-binding protein [Planctomycetota bacterium]|nr:ABC transporter ATP-binding protein [Planctomycetota bacterium]
MSAATRLEFDQVSKWYGTVSALVDVGFSIGQEVVGLVGRNGAGKSTLMKLAAGLLRPSIGRVRVAGEPAGTRAANEALGFSPDFERLYEGISGREFVAWMLRLHGVSRRMATDRAGALLTDLGLGEHMHRRIGEYSKGMRQRVRLAQALGHRPSFLLLDEPMNGLDPMARRELAQRMRSLSEQGIGILVSSHVLHELEAMVDRVVLIHQGRLMAEGRVADLRGQLRGQPHRVRVASAAPRDLAVRLAGLVQVQGIEVGVAGVEVALSGEPGFYAALTEIGAEPQALVQELLPLDDSLASVFGYLVG